ncbi:MAG: hypothetical protein OXT09_22240 [Myxococcales bacterium]|nr:hypothetical protein [Myxococcales bacterium]
MNTRDQSICLWLVPFFGVLFLLGLAIFPGLFPPLSPTMGAEEVAAFYRENVAGIRTTMILFNVIGIGFIPFFMVIVVQMMRMGNPSRAFAYSYLSAAASGGTLFALADLAWLNAVARPDRDPQLTLLLNDLAWLSLVTPVGFIITQNLCLALGIYMDARPRPVFPRWVAHFNIVTALLMVPGAFAIVYTTGPLAWDGSLSFGLRMGTFALYIAVMFFVTRSAIRQQAEEERGVGLGLQAIA